MAETDSRSEDYNEDEYENFETQEEQPQEGTYESYAARQAVEETVEDDEDDIPDKYKGKDVRDIIAMHQNAEKLLGKQSSEVGELRKIVDNFIQAQTAKEQAAQEQQVNNDLDDLDFFEDPKAAVAKMLESHPSVKQSRETAVRLAQQETIAKLNANHPDFKEIVGDPAFGEWVGKSKVRTDMLRKADAYDYDSADELFSLWKDRQGIVNAAIKDEKKARKQSVKSGSTGNAKGSGERPSKKMYRRADIVELMTKQPERYQALAAEIRQAYAEGRVI